MFIKSLTKATPIREHQIDSNIQKLYVVGSCALPLVGVLNPVKYLAEYFSGVKISLSKQTKEGNEPILLPISLFSVAEICSNMEGHINVKSQLMETETPKTDFELTIDLSSYGAVELSEGFLLLSLDATASPIDLNIEVYGLESPVSAPYFTEYKQLKVNANTVKSIALVGKSLLSIPRNNFEQIDIVFPDRTVTYKKDVKAICQALENVVANFVLLASGSSMSDGVYAQTYLDGINFYTIGVEHAIEAKVLYSADTNVIVTGTKHV